MVSESILRTPLCTSLGIDLPIVQAPIGRVGGAALSAAVSNAGGLGMVGLSYATDTEIAAAFREMTEMTTRPYGVNLILARDQRHRLELTL